MNLRASRWSIRRQVWAVFALFLLTGLAVVVLDEIGQSRGRAALQALKNDPLRELRTIKTISDTYGLDLVDTTARVRNGTMSWPQGLAVVDAARARIDRLWPDLQAVPHDRDETALFAELRSARQRADAAAAELRGILVSGDADALSYFATHRLYPAIDPIVGVFKRLSDKQLVEAEEITQRNLERQERFRIVRIGLSTLTFLLAAVVAHRILRNAYRGIESLAGLAEGMRRHEFTTAPAYQPRGELGQVMESFVRMRSEVRAFEIELTEQLASNERVRAELERREHFLSSLLSAAQAAIMAIDDQGRWIVFNPFAEELLGWRAEEVIGRVMRYRTPPDPDAGPLLATPGQIEATVAMLEATLGRKVTPDWHAVFELAALRQAPGEWRLLRRDGTFVPVWMALSAFKDERGRQAGVIAVATDLTERKQLERDLRDSELRARAASEAKSSFLATMSHEIRTPMIGVTGMVEVLSQTRLDTEQRHALNVIQASAEALLRIIGDILDFSKIEAGRLELAPAATDLGQLVRDVVASYSGAASSKGLVLETAIGGSLAPAYRVDPLRLRQILANFLSNAIKFTEQGRVDVALERVGEAGTLEGADSDLLQLSVRDTGIGISQAQRLRLFEPFSQAESDTTRRYGGTGLGLAICQRLAELMGGDIGMDSAPGRGTTIRLTLRLPHAPATEVVAPQATLPGEPPLQVRAAPSVAEAEAAGTLVLLIDDHPTNRMVITRQLALAGFACETADDGNAGLERWRTGRYGLVLTDVHMPGLDGYQLARMMRWIEAQEGRPRTPIVALTASALKGEAERCLAAGMDDCLFKPVPLSELAACLQRWLPHKAAAAHATDAVASDAIAGTSRVLDESALAALTGGAPGEARLVMDDFLDATDQDLASLDQAMAGEDLAELTRQAHKIKGAARLVGTQELADAASALEAAGRKGSWEHVPALAAELRAAVARVRLCVERRYPAA